MWSIRTCGRNFSMQTIHHTYDHLMNKSPQCKAFVHDFLKRKVCGLFRIFERPDLSSASTHWWKSACISKFSLSKINYWMDWQVDIHACSSKVELNSQLQKKINRPHQVDLEWAMLHSYLLVSPACRCFLVDLQNINTCWVIWRYTSPRWTISACDSQNIEPHIIWNQWRMSC